MLDHRQDFLSDEWASAPGASPLERRARPESAHRRAIDRLALELRAEEGLLCRFHSGLVDSTPKEVLARGTRCRVDLEQSRRIEGRRVVPDLTVRCARTDRLFFVIEVWHSHAVDACKRKAFEAGSIPWLEVRSLHVIWRRRGQALPVLDWGGFGGPAPCQGPLAAEG